MQRRNRRRLACSAHPDLMRFQSLWDNLAWDAMSGDETDYVQGKVHHVVTKLPWRSQEAEIWARKFDFVDLMTRHYDSGSRKRGAQPLQRFRGSSRVDQFSDAPRGLPENFYDKEWLAQADRAKIKPKPPVDLTHTETLLR